jgi:ankyrin repeat protein
VARKRRTLPKDFEELLKARDLDALKKVYDQCELTAYNRPSSKHTALHFRDCPDELARWLVGWGLDVDTRDALGYTPLSQKVIWGDGVPVLLELGADVNTQDDHGYAPLHHAITRNSESVRLLIEHGADMTIYYASDFSSFCDVPPPPIRTAALRQLRNPRGCGIRPDHARRRLPGTGERRRAGNPDRDSVRVRARGPRR